MDSNQRLVCFSRWAHMAACPRPICFHKTNWSNVFTWPGILGVRVLEILIGIGIRTWFRLLARSVFLPASPGKGLYSQRPWTCSKTSAANSSNGSSEITGTQPNPLDPLASTDFHLSFLHIPPKCSLLPFLQPMDPCKWHQLSKLSIISHQLLALTFSPSWCEQLAIATSNRTATHLALLPWQQLSLQLPWAWMQLPWQVAGRTLSGPHPDTPVPFPCRRHHLPQAAWWSL